MLKPCPFCGGEAQIDQINKNQLKIFCIQCGVKITGKVLRFSLEWLEKQLTDVWNKRYLEKEEPKNAN